MGERIRGPKGVAMRRRRMERTNWLCERCMGLGRWAGKIDKPRPTPAVRVNHIVPLIRDGEDVDENTENLCRPCDLAVTAEQFGFKVKPTIGADGWDAE